MLISLTRMGVDHGGTCPPRIWSGGTLMQIVPPPRFCHIGTKMSVLWPSNYTKIRSWPGLCPGPRWGSSRRFPDPLVDWREDTPPYATPRSARTHLWRSPCVPQKSSQIYAYAYTGLEPVGGYTTMSVTHSQCIARPTVTFPASERHCLLTGTKLYCFVTEANRTLPRPLRNALPRQDSNPRPINRKSDPPSHPQPSSPLYFTICG